MAQQLNEFLQEYFKLVRMMEMRDNHTEQWAQFEDLVTSGDMTKDQKKWADKLFQKDANGNLIRNAAGEYQIKPLPNSFGAHDELERADWETLFRICQNVFYQMNRNRTSYAGNTNVLDFLNEWQHLFTGTNQASLVATQATENQCTSLANLLTAHKDFLKDKLERDSDWAGILDSSTNYQSIIDGLNSKKYNKDDKFREKIQNLAGKINNAYETDSVFAQKIGTKPNLRLIYDIYAPGWNQPNIDPNKLQTFQEQYPSLLKTLYKDNKVLEAFKTNEGDDNRVSSAVEKAKNDIDYDKTDSKNYVPPKRDDALTPIQQIQKWASDTYENCLEKYVKLKGDRLFFSEYAKSIAKALDKNGVKPTDGFAGLLDKKSKIAGTLKYSPNASAHFDWLTKTIEEFSNDPNMKKTMEGALKNGRQMRNLISELIIKAVDDGKPETIQAAKTSMEVLSVMKYGMTTSKTKDALGKTDLTIFSDKNLSWNKSEGMQFVSNALDKSIKTAFMAVGYGVTMIGNEIRLSGSKFNKQFQHGAKDKTGAKLRSMSNAHDANVAAERAAFDTNKAAADAADNAAKTQQINKRDSALNDLGLAGRPDAKKAVSNKERAIQEVLRPAQSDAYSLYQPMQERLETYDNVLQAMEKRSKLQRKLSELNSRLTASPTPAETLSIQEEIKLLSADIAKNREEIEQYQGLYSPELDDLDTKTPLYIQTLRDNFEASPEYVSAKDSYDRISDEIYRRENAIKRFRDAEGEIKNLDDALEKRAKKEREWDKDHKNLYQELVAYWDMLETGRDSHTGKMYSWALGSKKLKQQAFSANANTYISNFMSSYGRAS